MRDRSTASPFACPRIGAPSRIDAESTPAVKSGPLSCDCCATIWLSAVSSPYVTSTPRIRRGQIQKKSIHNFRRRSSTFGPAMTRLPHCVAALTALTLVAACRATPTSQGSNASGDAMRAQAEQLPTGVVLDPVGTSQDVGSLPLSMTVSPDGGYFVLVNSGYSEQGAQIVERATRRVIQTLTQPAAFVGATFSRDGHELFVSGGNRDLIYRYAWNAGHAELRDSIVLEHIASRQDGRRYPAGVAASRDGRFLYVAENLGDALAVVDLSNGMVLERHATQRYPYDVVVA